MRIDQPRRQAAAARIVDGCAAQRRAGKIGARPGPGDAARRGRRARRPRSDRTSRPARSSPGARASRRVRTARRHARLRLAVKTLFAANALLPSGWAKDVALEIDAQGNLASIRPGSPPSAGDACSRPGPARDAERPLARVPASARRPDRTRRRGERFVLVVAREDVRARRARSIPTTSRRSRPRPTSRCCAAVSPRSANSITCIMRRTARPTRAAAR